MRAKDQGLTRADLELLHRALSYRVKRVHDQAALVRLRGLLGRVETLILEEAVQSSLRLSPPEQELLARELPLYAAEMTQRGGSEQGAVEARRLAEINSILSGRRGPPRGHGGWRRLSGR
jgi:hypothetical protein